jgi:stalled ribosome rescue protein Dom34
MAHFHAVIWIDHREARVFHFNPAEADKLVVHPHDSMRHIQHKANATGTRHAPEDEDFYHRVVEAVADAGEILITGPANAKTELVKHIHHHDAALMSHIKGIETVDHPTDGELVAHARKYFKAEDLMTPQKR